MPTLVGGAFSQGNVTLEELILEGIPGPGQDHIVHTQSFGWKMRDISTQHGELAGMRIAGSFHHGHLLNVDQALGQGIQHDGVDCRLNDVYVASPNEEGIHYTFVAVDNVDTNIKVAGAWTGPSTGPAILVDGTDNLLDAVKVRANSGATWAIEYDLGAEGNVLGTHHLDPGTAGVISEPVNTANEIYNNKRALHLAYFS